MKPKGILDEKDIEYLHNKEDGLEEILRETLGERAVVGEERKTPKNKGTLDDIEKDLQHLRADVDTLRARVEKHSELLTKLLEAVKELEKNGVCGEIKKDSL